MTHDTYSGNLQDSRDIKWSSCLNGYKIPVYRIPVYLLFFDFGKHLQGFGDNESVQLALSATGPTITAAGLIFAFTFDAGNKNLGIGRIDIAYEWSGVLE